MVVTANNIIYYFSKEIKIYLCKVFILSAGERDISICVVLLIN